MGEVYTNAKYFTEAGVNWTVPASQGAYPTFAAYATNDEKKLAISEFIRDKHGIKVVDAVWESIKTNSSRTLTKTISSN